MDNLTRVCRYNVSMLIDLYELTMASTSFNGEMASEMVTFDVFYRNNPDGGSFAIFAGLEQVIECIQNFHFEEEDINYLRSLSLFKEDFLDYLKHFYFKGDLYAFMEGTIIYPNEPILTIVAPLIDGLLVETIILTQLNHQSLIATKAQRIVRAAQGRSILDFGARRAHNIDAALYGARAAYIGGVEGTSNLLAGEQFDIPVVGTMAHSWVMYFNDEYTAFRKYAEQYPDNVVLLIDTYNVLNSGLPNAIRVAKEILLPQNKRLKGIRIDSGDLAYLSKRIRVILDQNGLTDCKITVSNRLDEFTISSLLGQKGCIDVFGVGERLITASSDPIFGAVYKLVAIGSEMACIPKIKTSESFEKITNPGRKKVYRVYDAQGKAIADLITLANEQVKNKGTYHYINPNKPWEKLYFENCTFKELQQLFIKQGKRTANKSGLREIRDFVIKQLEVEILEEEQRFENPQVHFLNMSEAYYSLKIKLLEETKMI